MQDARVVLITGASAGIGAAIACRLARDGYRVFGTTRRLENLANSPPELLAAAATEAAPLQPASGRYPIRMLELDVTDQGSVDRCVARVLAEASRIDVLVNNAGWNAFGPLEEFPVAKAEELFQTIYFGALRMMRAVTPGMRLRGAGLILNISSIAARAVIPFQVHYSAAKAALNSLSFGLYQQLRPFGVRVVSLEPSDIRTRTNEVTVFGQVADSPYKPWTDRCWRTIEENMAKAPDPALVAAKVSRIMRARRPKPLYTCGSFLQRIAPGVFRFLPKSLELWLTRVFYGL
ncbi:MAG: SDR family NAD(P)-dependent oxidoreductase [Patescibacteria group bacterium]